MASTKNYSFFSSMPFIIVNFLLLLNLTDCKRSGSQLNIIAEKIHPIIREAKKFVHEYEVKWPLEVDQQKKSLLSNHNGIPIDLFELFPLKQGQIISILEKIEEILMDKNVEFHEKNEQLTEWLENLRKYYLQNEEMANFENIFAKNKADCEKFFERRGDNFPPLKFDLQASDALMGFRKGLNELIKDILLRAGHLMEIEISLYHLFSKEKIHIYHFAASFGPTDFMKQYNIGSDAIDYHYGGQRDVTITPKGSGGLFISTFNFINAYEKTVTFKKPVFTMHNVVELNRIASRMQHMEQWDMWNIRFMEHGCLDFTREFVNKVALDAPEDEDWPHEVTQQLRYRKELNEEEKNELRKQAREYQSELLKEKLGLKRPPQIGPSSDTKESKHSRKD